MKFRRLRRINRGQQGFTLIEIIATLAITGLIGVGAAMATVQIFNQGSHNSDYTTASRHTMNAIYWISRDAQMSQIIEPDGAAGFPLTLSWTEWDNSGHQVIYALEDDKLRRSYSADGGEPNETVVAQYINSVSDNTTCAVSDNMVILRVTATVGTGSNAVSVTKTRDIVPRPNL